MLLLLLQDGQQRWQLAQAAEVRLQHCCCWAGCLLKAHGVLPPLQAGLSPAWEPLPWALPLQLLGGEPRQQAGGQQLPLRSAARERQQAVQAAAQQHRLEAQAWQLGGASLLLGVLLGMLRLLAGAQQARQRGAAQLVRERRRGRREAARPAAAPEAVWSQAASQLQPLLAEALPGALLQGVGRQLLLHRHRALLMGGGALGQPLLLA